MLVKVNTMFGPQLIRVCDYCGAVPVDRRHRFCSSRCYWQNEERAQMWGRIAEKKKGNADDRT